MKKNLIALAVAGALVAPVAMAEVTISGGLQAELVQIGGDASSKNGLYAADGWQAATESKSNYGWLKFAANEDLGGGMKALAVYTFNANVGDNTATDSPAGTAGADLRDAYVGLVTGAGTILAGTVTSPYAQSRGLDPFVATSFQARGNNGMTTLHNGYISNTLAYANSFMGGMVKLTAGVALDEQADGDFDGAGPDTASDKTTGKHATSFALDIAPMSGLTATIAYINLAKFGTNAAATAEGADKRVATKVAVKYATGPFSVAAQMEMLDKGLAKSGDKGNVIYLTGSFNMDDANTISVSYGQTDKKVNSSAAQVLAGTDDAATYMAVGFKHAFSKNTSALIGYRASEDKAGAGSKETAVGAGLRVNF